MFIQSSWHPPRIVVHIMLSPDAGQLKLSNWPPPSRKRTDHAHEAELDRERQDRKRDRDIDSKTSGDHVEWNEDVLIMLVETGHIQKDERDNRKIVTKAINDLVSEWGQAWKKGKQPAW
jgi:hypothetical protein